MRALSKEEFMQRFMKDMIKKKKEEEHKANIIMRGYYKYKKRNKRNLYARYLREKKKLFNQISM